MNTFERKGFCLLFSLDISGAFNNARPPYIIKSLKEKKCPSNLLFLSKSYFENRRAELWFQNIQVLKDLNRGCPQGSACGPGFWKIFSDELLKIPIHQDSDINGFADDILLAVYADTIEEIETRANNAIELIMDWAKSVKINFNAEKTQMILCTRRIKFNEPVIKINGYTIQRQSSFKYLGVFIDSKFTFSHHISYIKGKVLRVTMQILRFAKQNYGIGNKFYTTIYRGVIQPMLSYGCAVWFNVVKYKYVEKI
jgi:hypothetical protein